MVILALLCQQLLVGAHLRDPLVGYVQDAVAVFDGGEPVGDDEGGAALQQRLQALLHQLFRFGVNGGGSLVQHLSLIHI